MTAPADTSAEVTPPTAPDEPRESLLRRSTWLLAALVAGALTVVIMGVLPADRTINNVGEWAFRISPVVFAVISAAYFPRRPGLNLILLAVLIFGYMGVIDTWTNIRVLNFSEATDQHAAFPALYQMLVFLDALFIIAVCFAYRLGGAKTYKVVRLGIAGILVLTSGLNDLVFYYVYAWPAPDGRPARLDWASHITVFIGGTPTPTAAIVFCAVNLLLAAAVIVVPWYVQRRRTAAAAALSSAR